MEGPDSETLLDLAEDAPVGLVTTLRGVSWLFRDEEKARTYLRQEILVKDRLRTELASSLKVTFLDHSVLTLAGESEVSIRAYLYDGVKGLAKFSVEEGLLHFAAGVINRVSPERFHVETATATIGIRGSAGWIRVHPNLPGQAPTVDVRVDEGHALEVRSHSGQVQRIIRPRMGVRILPTGQIVPLPLSSVRDLRTGMPSVLPRLYRPSPAPQVPGPVSPPPSPVERWLPLLPARAERRRRSTTMALAQLAEALFEQLDTPESKQSAPPKIHALEARETLGNEALGPEQASSQPMLQRLAAETRQKLGEPKSPPQARALDPQTIARESSSSLTALQGLGQAYLDEAAKKQLSSPASRPAQAGQEESEA
jgi:hypothetical protein